MRKVIALAFVALMAFSLASFLAPNAAAEEAKITVAVDLSHGESDKYLGYIQGNITFVNWVNITEAPITSDTLAGVDVLIIGQPTVGFSPDEMEAIYQWLTSGNKILWIAGDSDYGSGNETQVYVNNLLEYIGAKLRIEYASFYDDIHNCERFYRVLVHIGVDPVPELQTDIISEGIEKPILAHGPAPLIWVDDEGNPHDIVNETFPGLIRILWSYDTAYIGDNNPPLPLVYDPLFYGQGAGNFTFVFLAAEYWEDTNSLIVVSGESPYGDYEPTWAWEYYGVELDGPKFVTNMITWFNTLITEVWGQPTETTTTTTTTTTTQTTTTSPAQPPASPTTTTTTAEEEKGNTILIAAIIVILIIIAAAYFFMKK